MASVQRKGSADILYTPLGASPTVFLLAVPLLISPREGFAANRKRRYWEVWNDDGTIRETFALGTTTEEIRGRIRFDDTPDELRAMLEEARWNDVTLTYRPTGAGGPTYPTKLVSVAGAPPGEIVIVPDQSRYVHGEYQTELILRRVDGGSFDSLLT